MICFVPSTSSTELVGCHVNCYVAVFIPELFWQGWNSLCLETHLFLLFPKLDFRAFDISFNFHFCKKDGAFLKFNIAAGDFYNLVSEFYF